MGIQQVKAGLPIGWELLPAGSAYLDQFTTLWAKVQDEVGKVKAAEEAARAAREAAAGPFEPPAGATGGPFAPGQDANWALALEETFEDEDMLDGFAETAVGPKSDDESTE
eukprot:3352356-Heterocapsa_arctica.AAC.1